MARRPTTTELLDRIDGLALAFFAVLQAVQQPLVEMHPDNDRIVDRMREEGLRLLYALDRMEQDVFSTAAREQAYFAVLAAFVPWNEEERPEAGAPANDDERR